MLVSVWSTRKMELVLQNSEIIPWRVFNKIGSTEFKRT